MIRQRAETCSDPRYSNFLKLDCFPGQGDSAWFHQAMTLAQVLNEIVWFEVNNHLTVRPEDAQLIRDTYRGVPSHCY